MCERCWDSGTGHCYRSPHGISRHETIDSVTLEQDYLIGVVLVAILASHMACTACRYPVILHVERDPHNKEKTQKPPSWPVPPLNCPRPPIVGLCPNPPLVGPCHLPSWPVSPLVGSCPTHHFAHAPPHSSPCPHS